MTDTATQVEIEFDYDYENRLVEITYPSGTTEFVYDALGRRLKRVEKNAVGGVTAERHYMHDGLDLLAELTSAGQLVAGFTHGPGIDDPLIARYNNANYYYHENHLGSATEITDASRNVVKSYEYDAYGNILSQPGADVPFGFTYTGRELHSRSGLKSLGSSLEL